MKIGILTFHFACNYGAVLQCYALQRYLVSRGHDAYVMDYRPDAVAGGYRWFDIRRFWGSNPLKFYHKTVSELKVISERRRRYAAFGRFVLENLPLTPAIRTSDDILNVSKGMDMIIIGSDQVWNPRITGGIDPFYWGNIPDMEAPVISYAASMEDGFSDEVKKAVEAFLPGFKAISVREETLRRALLDLMPDMAVSTVVDPTLLAEIDVWDAFSGCPVSDEPYLLFYQVRRSPEAYSAARTLAETKGLRLVSLSAKVELENTPDVAASSPQEFVELFRNAAYVVTTSFHGTVFSILFKKPFVCVEVQDGKGARQSDLLSSLGLSDRLTGCKVTEELPPIDWKEVDRRLTVLKKSSEEYLKSCGI